jgi:Holliday junction DNA helicase RuvA
LYGFATEPERELFRALLKVNGVGPKVALAILSGASAEAFRAAVATEDVAGLVRIPGVGRKTAERLVVEMRDHFKDSTTLAGGLPVAHTPREEALHALQALGYKPPEAQRMLEKVATDGASTEDLIRAALQGTTLKQERK